MKMFAVLPLVLATSAAAQGLLVGSATQPSLAGIYSVAPGSLVAAVPFNPGFLPVKDVAGLKLELQVRGAPQIFAATVVAADSNMVLATLPANIPIGWKDATLTYGTAQITGRVYISASSVSLFTGLWDGTGAALAQNIADDASASLNRLTNPAAGGQYITLWGTGLGRFGTGDVVVDVYGTKVRPTFAGHAPGIPGVDQINFRLPANTPEGCYVPVTVSVAEAGDVSNTVALATSSSLYSPCKHPLGLTNAQLKTLDEGGSLMLGSVSADDQLGTVSEQGVVNREERATVLFRQVNALRAFSGLLPSSTAQCTLYSSQVVPTFRAQPLPSDHGPSVYGDAGPALTMLAPDGKQVSLKASNSVYVYSASPVPVTPGAPAPPPMAIPGGQWTLGAPGGASMDAFQKTFTMPAAETFTNREALAQIDRNSDLTVTWRPQAGFEETVSVGVESVNANDDPLPAGASYSVTCRVTGANGRLTVPRAMLRELTATQTGIVSRVTLQVDIAPAPQFTVPMKGSGSAPVSASRSHSESFPVTLR